MEALIDCDIMEFCAKNQAERDFWLQGVWRVDENPAYSVPVFELCRGLHLCVKRSNLHPSVFRHCWWTFTQQHSQIGNFSFHVDDYDSGNLPAAILDLPEFNRNEAPPSKWSGDAETYWDNYHALTARMRRLQGLLPMRGWWESKPPAGEEVKPIVKEYPEGDIVLDTNVLVDLLDKLPENGPDLNDRDFDVPDYLSTSVKRRFRRILSSNGIAGKFIVPLSALEEADRVIDREASARYVNARKVLNSMRIIWERWQAFAFEPLTQDVFDYFILLYEELKSDLVRRQRWADFGDMLILAHGLYHGCQVASKEWGGQGDVWAVVKNHFDFLVLE